MFSQHALLKCKKRIILSCSELIFLVENEEKNNWKPHKSERHKTNLQVSIITNTVTYNSLTLSKSLEAMPAGKKPILLLNNVRIQIHFFQKLFVKKDIITYYPF